MEIIGAVSGTRRQKYMNNLSEALNAVIDKIFSEFFTALPAKIETYDETQQKASIKPLIKRKYIDGNEAEIPVISNVPVMFPRVKEAYIHFPIKKGDFVLAIFADRSLDKWLSKGTITTPDDPRKHDISDAIILPGLIPFSNFGDALIPENNTDLILQYKESKIIIRKNGNVYIKGDTELDGDLEVNGDVQVNGQIKATGDIIAGDGTTNISLLNHTHIGNLGSPTSPPTP